MQRWTGHADTCQPSFNREDLDGDAARRFDADYTTAEGEVIFDRGEPVEEREEEGEQLGLF